MGKAAQYLSVSELERIAETLFQVKDRKQGELIGLCPVHDDHDPSFSYNPVKNHLIMHVRVHARAYYSLSLSDYYKKNLDHLDQAFIGGGLYPDHGPDRIWPP